MYISIRSVSDDYGVHKTLSCIVCCPVLLNSGDDGDEEDDVHPQCHQPTCLCSLRQQSESVICPVIRVINLCVFFVLRFFLPLYVLYRQTLMSSILIAKLSRFNET